MKDKKAFRTLLTSVLFSASGPIVLGIGLLMLLSTLAFVKIPLVLAVLVPSSVRLLMFLLFVVSISLFIFLLRVFVMLLSVTLRPLLSVLLMSS